MNNSNDYYNHSESLEQHTKRIDMEHALTRLKIQEADCTTEEERFKIYQQIKLLFI